MTDQLRSKDGSRDSDGVLGQGATPSGAGRSGGRLARDIGTRDEKERADKRPACATRVRESEKEETKDA